MTTVTEHPAIALGPPDGVRHPEHDHALAWHFALPDISNPKPHWPEYVTPLRDKVRLSSTPNKLRNAHRGRL